MNKFATCLLLQLFVVDRNTPVIIDTPLQLSKVGVAVP
jgi:hypothetical protein